MSTQSTILVVEDEPLVRMLAVEECTEAGFHVLEAANADEALELAASERIALMFTDIDMPGSMDGVRLAYSVSRRWPPVQIVVTSGRPRPLKDLPAGSVFVQKPYDFAELSRDFARMVASR